MPGSGRAEGSRPVRPGFPFKRPLRPLGITSGFNFGKHLAAADAVRRMPSYTVCDIATNGVAAVRSAAKHQPDLVLMDILLDGDMNGIEAAELIHNQLDVPIVFITCLSEPAMRVGIIDRVIQCASTGSLIPFSPAKNGGKGEIPVRRREGIYQALFGEIGQEKDDLGE